MGFLPEDRLAGRWRRGAVFLATARRALPVEGFRVVLLLAAMFAPFKEF